jgi:predicted MFS family arabinose efflux permease
MVFGPIIGGTLSKISPWAPPLGAAIMAALDLLAAYLWMPETRKPDAAEARSERVIGPSFRDLLSARLSLILAMYFLVFLCVTTLQVALALLTKARLGWTAVEVGRVFGLFGSVMLIVQGVLPSWLARTFGEPRVVSAGTLSAAAGLLVIALAQQMPAMLCGILLLALGLGLTQPFLAALAAQQVGKEQYGAALGLAQSSGGLARVIGPVASGLVYERLGASAPFFGGACAALLAFGLSLLLRVSESRAAT